MTEGWIPSERGYLIDDLCRNLARVSANEGWFRQIWLGVELWQMPEDLIRLQALIWDVKPDWIVETGTKFGGSAIFFASLLQLSGGRPDAGVVSVDVRLSDEVRDQIARHPQGGRVRALIEGDAADPAVIAEIAAQLESSPGRVLVFLDDNHNADHVYQEMIGYAPLVSVGSYLVVADTVFADLAGTPVGQTTEKYPDVARSNPRVAIERFLAERGDFERKPAPIPHGPGNFLDAFLQRVC
ncbi:Rhamnosyl O-methyltransferase precursor [Thiorhodovibrio winogradskyi]|uniref:Rhamnosyl O-methyltransferase n=1 Tax=Thiorhodovibrio winogradskyi TaxID=77007 RepID=A0ABZ0SC21_9GAMM|nr:CmcI family methyltransferase [Thiorhodovibrio winogradskyi]